MRAKAIEALMLWGDDVDEEDVVMLLLAPV
jgi:hypothetical protein